MSRAEMRRGARLSVVQALYEMEIGGRGVVEAMAEFEAFWIGKEVENIELPKAEINFFRDLLSGVVREQRLIDRSVDDVLASKWPLKRVEAVVRAHGARLAVIPAVKLPEARELAVEEPATPSRPVGLLRTEQ